MTEAREIIGGGFMIGIEEDILLLDLNPEDIIIQEDHIKCQKIIQTEVSTDSSDLEVHLDPNYRRPRVASQSPSRDSDRCFSCRQSGDFARECSKKDTAVDKTQ